MTRMVSSRSMPIFIRRGRVRTRWSLRCRQVSWIALSIGLWTSPRPSRAQSPDRLSFPSDSALRLRLERFITEGRSVGIVVGLLEPNGERRVLAFGSPGPGKLPLDGNSVFQIASITKAFTGTLLASLIVDRTVSMDDPVQRWLPSEVRVPQRNGRMITLRDLATHTSALPRMSPDLPPDSQLVPSYTVDRLYASISGIALTRQPGERWEYSNIGVSLLGHALAHAAGQPYEQLLAERILTALGLEHTAVSLTSEMEEHLALGYDQPGNCRSVSDCRSAVVPVVVASPAIVPAGGLYSTTNDLFRFLAANIDAHNRPTGALGRAMALAHQVHYEGTRKDGSPLLQRLIWYDRPTPHDTIFWTGGGTRGYATFIAFTSSGRAVVVLTNSGTPHAYDFGFHLLDPSLPPIQPLPPTPKKKKWPAAAIVGVAAGLAIGGWWLRRNDTR